MSSEAADSDHFLIPDGPESRRILTDSMIGSDRFRLYKSGRISVNPISGYERRTVYIIGIRWKVIDQIRWLGGTGILIRPTGSDAPSLTWDGQSLKIDFSSNDLETRLDF